VPSTTQTARDPLGGPKAALGAFALGVRRNFANWPILMGRSLFYLVVMAVLSALWTKVAAQRLPGTLATVLPAGGLALYVGVTEWITLSITSIHLRLEDDIRFGLLEPHLLRPKPYLLQKIAEALGDTFGRLIGLGLTAVAMLVLFAPALPSFQAFGFALVLGLLGAAIGVLLFTLTGLAAFWVRRVLPPYLIMQKSMFLLGGLFAPISLYPTWFYHLGLVTPFAANIFYPANQMLEPSAQTFAVSLAAQIVWIAALSFLIAIVWRAGLRKILREGL
jgi:ABC-2 type transport system permease protein